MLRSSAVTGAPTPSLTVIVITSVPTVVKSPKFDNVSAASVAVTTPSVSAAMSLRSVIVGLPVIVTFADSATTFVESVTNAAVNWS